MIPLRNLIAVKPCASDEISEGGIIVPENMRERSSKAKIIAAGETAKLRVGYTVFHVKGAGDEVVESGEVFYLMPETDVLGYLEN